jgi:hypothetical protein
MNALHTFATASAVASCTLAAAHRRDHNHGVDVVACHPHVVEVVHLGEHAAMICHDCRTDSGFLPHREAERMASAHRHETDATPHSPAA